MFNFSNMAEIVTYSLSRTRFTGIYHLQCDHNFVLEKTCQVGKKALFGYRDMIIIIKHPRISL